jgi:hypothetical protein
MSVIYKYHLKPEGNTNLCKIDLPQFANLLTVHAQGNKAYLWAEIDPEEKTVPRYFEIFATGQEIVYDMGVSREYFGTFFLDCGLVFHVYKRHF